MAPPGRAVAALGSALRAFVLNVLALAVIGGLGYAAGGLVDAGGNPGGALLGFWIGVFVGGVAGAAAGGVHAVAQLLVVPFLPTSRRRPVSPALATVVSAVLAGAVLSWAASEDDRDAHELPIAVAAGVVYVAGTWPVANALVPPGRPRRRRPDVAR